jgi:type I restriction enzyme, S subunit
MKQGWKVEKLGDVCDVFADGDWVESKDQSPSGIRLIQTGNVGNGIFKDRGEKARYVSEETFKRLRCTEIFEGDCLISRLPDPVGRACILPDTGERMITAVDCTIVRFDKKQIIPQFFNYYSQSFQYLNDVDHETTGTTRSRISRSKLSEIKIPVPPLTEQQRIIALLDETFAALNTVHANAERNRINAKEVFEVELEKEFSDGSNWQEKLLGDVCKVAGDLTRDIDSSLPYIGADSIESNTGRLVQKKSALEQGTRGPVYLFSGKKLLYSKIRPYLNKLSITNFKGYCSSDMYPLEFDKSVLYEFASHYLLSKRFLKSISGFYQRASIPKINREQLFSVTFPVPPLATQHAIVTKLEALSTETKKLEEVYQCKVDAVEELRKSIMQKAFEGSL